MPPSYILCQRNNRSCTNFKIKYINMNAADVLVSLFVALTVFMGIYIIFGMIYIFLAAIFSARNAKKMDRRIEKRLNKNKYSNL